MLQTIGVRLLSLLCKLCWDWFRLVSLIILSFIILSPVIPSSIIPASPTAKNSWVHSLKQSSRYNGLDPNFWLWTRVPSCLPSFCFVPSPAIPASPITKNSWVEFLEAGGHHPFISSLFILYPFILSPFIWSLIVLSPHHLFILSPFMLSAFIFSPTIISLSCSPLPSSYFPASLHVVSLFPPIGFS